MLGGTQTIYRQTGHGAYQVRLGILDRRCVRCFPSKPGVLHRVFCVGRASRHAISDAEQARAQGFESRSTAFIHRSNAASAAALPLARDASPSIPVSPTQSPATNTPSQSGTLTLGRPARPEPGFGRSCVTTSALPYC